ncbi:hypothetical protein [Peribacillus frigoritolerans]|uniref:hypothetical protein n=1 Tax=Peribacillus frigoritolerans TaxID=450367 RepID=UPI003F7F3B4F
MRKYFILTASVISIGLLSACMQKEKAVDKKAPVEESAHVEKPTDVEELSSEEVDETAPEKESGKEYSGLFGAMLSYYAKAFDGGVEKENAEIMKEEGYPIEYYYLAEAQSFTSEVDANNIPKVLVQDFNNLLDLSYIIHQEQDKVLDGVTLPEGTDKFEAHKYWNPPTDRQKQAITYMKYVFNDLDIVANGIKGQELTGYTYHADGKKVEELEKFINKKDS